MRVLTLLSHILTHDHSQGSPTASSGCSRCVRWLSRPPAQLGQAHRMNGGPGRWCCGVASATPRCRSDFESHFLPTDAGSGDHRQQSPTRAGAAASPPPACSPGVPGIPGVHRFRRRMMAASAAILFQQCQRHPRSVESSRSTRLRPWVTGLTCSPGVPCSPGVLDSRRWPWEGPPHSWFV